MELILFIQQSVFLGGFRWDHIKCIQVRLPIGKARAGKVKSRIDESEWCTRLSNISRVEINRWRPTRKRKHILGLHIWILILQLNQYGLYCSALMAIITTFNQIYSPHKILLFLGPFSNALFYLLCFRNMRQGSAWEHIAHSQLSRLASN